MPRASRKGRVPASIFLSCSICATSVCAAGLDARRSEAVGQPDARKMRDDPLRVLGRASPSAGRIIERQRHAGGDRLAVEQLLGKAGLRLQRMAEGVAEIEQRALAARFALVLGDDPRLGGDRMGDRVDARAGIAREQRRRRSPRTSRKRRDRRSARI